METLSKGSERLEMVFVCLYFFVCVEERRRRWFRRNNEGGRKHGSIKGRLGLRNIVCMCVCGKEE